jgi:PD-(D/E)XK nuclease superfamily
MPPSFKLSPSDLTFLWDECPRCFYLKVARNIPRPAAPFPKIFNRIDQLMKDYFGDRYTSEISPSLPDGVVRFGERWVTSAPIHIRDHDTSCYIKGKFDTVVEFSDASYGVVDFKTSETRPEHVDFYSRQLHAYAYALENPAPGAFALQPVSRLGLLCVEPVLMDRTRLGQIAYIGNVDWLECPKDESAFLGFIGQVLALLESPDPPPAGEKCSYCKYRDHAREHGM